jgi:hypothetical protein
MSVGETIVRQASLGLELVDELTDDSLVGDSHVGVFRTAVPDQELTPTTFLVGRSRWVFENLGTSEELRLVVDADRYFSEVLETGQTVPTLADPAGVAIPSVAVPGGFVRVRLRPRTGYPFTSGFTLVVGSVLFDGAPVTGADVTVTPLFQVGTTPGNTTPGTPFVTLTADDGQFVAWLFPDITQDNTAPVAFDVTVTSGALTGSVLNQALVPQTVNGVTITLSP